MAVQNIDIKIFYSGGASNEDPNASLGGIVSTTELANTQNNNLFDDTTYDEAVAGDTNYRCFYVINTHPTDTLYQAQVYFRKNSDSPTINFTLGLDSAGIGNGTSTGVATTIVDETEAPSGVVFTEQNSKEDALLIGNLAAGQGVAIWVRRVVMANTLPINNNSYAIQIFGLKSPE